MNPTGTSWLATAGSGDVLSGLAGSLLAQGLEPSAGRGRGRVPARHRRPAGRQRHRGPGSPLPAIAGITRTGRSPGHRRPPQQPVTRSRLVDAGAPIGASDLIGALPAATRWSPPPR